VSIEEKSVQHRTAVLGVWHVHARDYTPEAIARSGVEVVGVWDKDATAAAEFAGRYGLAPIAALDDVLADRTIDSVIVTTATADHPEIIGAALRAGKHVFTEKVLAANPGDVEGLHRLATSVERLLFVSLQRIPEPWVRTTRSILESGTVGRVASSRIRYQHGGVVEGWLPEGFLSKSEAGGGAVIDLGAHGFYLSGLFHGAYPTSVSCTTSRLGTHDVEDLAVVTLGYPDGSLSVLETSLSSSPSARLAEVFGEQGYLTVDSRDDAVYLRRAGEGGFEPQEGMEPGPSPIAQFFDLLDRGVTSVANRNAAIRLTALISAAYLSAETGITQLVTDPVSQDDQAAELLELASDDRAAVSS
jgi:1,5-anhydro-D-fructose reductase (1,5-anhydro-D-mannitol-forming)